jgi:hypothetical protein
MSIHNLGSAPGAGRPTGPTAPRTTLSGGMPAIGPADASEAATRARRDTVQISDAARALGGAERADAAPAAGRAPLTAERLAELRRRVVEGAYDAPSVADQVARRLRASGDL